MLRATEIETAGTWKGIPADVVRLDYVTTARSKGIGERAVVIRHVVRTARPYKPALSFDECRRTMAEEASKGLWDPEVVRAFFNMMQEQRLEPLCGSML